MAELWEMFEELDALTSKKERDDYVRAPFGWPGGKWLSLQYIIPEIERRNGSVFVDGCGGSGIITLNAPDFFKLKVFNDRHAGITAFFRCLQQEDTRHRLAERLSIVLHSREEWIWCKDTWEGCQDTVERAARWYYMLRLSFAQLGRNFGRSTSCNSMLAHKLRNSIELFQMIYDRFKDVQIENMDVIECIKDYDSPETVFHIDPDYIGADTGIYKHKVEHERLLDTIFGSKGTFLVSNYKNPIYDDRPWDSIKTWEIACSMQAQAFTEENHLLGKEGAMDRSRKGIETLYIRESQ